MLAFNHEKYISQAIDSILQQETDCKFEIVVGDDCSTDATRSILDDYQLRFPEIIVTNYQVHNIGIPANLLSTLLKCRGKYITILSGDDYWISNHRIQIEYDYLENNPTFYTVATVIESRYDNAKIGVAKNPHKQYCNKEFTMDDFLSGNNFPTSTVMFRNNLMLNKIREKFEYIGLASKRVDDLTFCMVLLDLGKLYILDVCTAVYRMHKPNVIKNSNYNSQVGKLESVYIHIELLNKLEILFCGKFDLSKRYSMILKEGIKHAIKEGNAIALIPMYKSINSRYRKPFIRSSILDAAKSLLFDQFINGGEK